MRSPVSRASSPWLLTPVPSPSSSIHSRFPTYRHSRNGGGFPRETTCTRSSKPHKGVYRYICICSLTSISLDTLCRWPFRYFQLGSPVSHPHPMAVHGSEEEEEEKDRRFVMHHGTSRLHSPGRKGSQRTRDGRGLRPCRTSTCSCTSSQLVSYIVCGGVGRTARDDAAIERGL